MGPGPLFADPALDVSSLRGGGTSYLSLFLQCLAQCLAQCSALSKWPVMGHE